eukprot:CAMPEP_0181096958 /NCGR_PEP_ID=MMETSP1071-20121207/11307_1 /TAXON_ID=35127 /ORGANISM="Thalassiosira sp., Strain NH16" /LENGTH=298 /DNA_ID=CAMNT_0023179395 /DNA_START=8 /DNA_END=904 /DNA_ORIENTATION=+
MSPPSSNSDDEDEELGASIYKSSKTAKSFAIANAKQEATALSTCTLHRVSPRLANIDNRASQKRVGDIDGQDNSHGVGVRTRSKSKVAQSNDDANVDAGGASPAVAVPSLKKSDANWERYLEELRDFKRKHGHTNVPERSKENPQLGQWVKSQRALFKKRGKKLTPQRIKTLEGMGFIFRPSRVIFEQNATLWEVRFNELKEFKKKNGHINVSQKSKDNPQLGRWVHNQRGRALTQQRIDKLHGIGFIFDGHAGRWEEHFNELKEFKNKHGHNKKGTRIVRWESGCINSVPDTALGHS